MILLWSSAILLAIALTFLLYFNRDPPRAIPRNARIVSPADGEVIEVTSVGTHATVRKGNGYTQFATDIPLPATMVRIFLSPLDVHVQRAPIAGIIESVFLKHGKRIPAFKERAWQNEHAEILIAGTHGPAKVVLIGGALAGRVRPSVTKGQIVKKGERIGKILLGSQVCLIFPQCHLNVKKGDRLRAGESIVA